MDSDEPRIRRRQGKKKNARKRRSRLPLAIGFCIGAVVIVGVGVVCWNVLVPAMMNLQVTATGPKADPYAWPPPPETPREQLFGTHDGEQIITAVGPQYRFPIRRRSIDPWFRLSNVRSCPPNPPYHHEKGFLIDVEMIQPPPPDVMPMLRAVSGVRDANNIKGLFHNPELMTMVRTKKTKTTMQVSMMFGTGDLQRVFDEQARHLEFYLFYMDSRYQYQLKCVTPTGYDGASPAFKVSNSVIVGSAQTSLPREWIDQEFKHLTGPPQQGVTTIEIEANLATETPMPAPALPVNKLF